MPVILYQWDFETGDTQGWALGPYCTIDNTSQIQGTYSIKYEVWIRYRTERTETIMSINNIDLTTATKPIMLFVIRDNGQINAVNDPLNITLNVKDSAGNLLMSWTVRVMKYGINFFKIVAFDLSAVAGMSGLTFEIVQYNYCSTGTVGDWRSTVYYDSIYIVDGGDKDYNIALLSLSNVDRTIDYDIPEADRSLPTDSARISVNLVTPPHPLNEDVDTFTYTATANTGSASITSRDVAHRHAPIVVTPTTPPSTFDKLSIRSFITSVTTGYYSFDEVVVVSFWSTGWELKAVYAFRVAITLNPYSPPYATAMFNVTYGAGWSGSRDFSLKVHARSLTIACYVKYLVGDNTVVQLGTVKVEVYSSDYSIKYGESAVDLTVGTELTGPDITGVPVDTDLKLRVSWSLSALSRVVLAVRPIFKVY